MKLALKLCSNEYDQEHLFSRWDATTKGDDEKKKKMMHQLELLDKNYQPGGICEYIKNEETLETSQGRANPFDGWHPSVPRGENVNYGSKKHRELEKIGLKQAKENRVRVSGGRVRASGWGIKGLK